MSFIILEKYIQYNTFIYCLSQWEYTLCEIDYNFVLLDSLIFRYSFTMVSLRRKYFKPDYFQLYDNLVTNLACLVPFR